MTTQIGASVFVDPSEITHSVIDGCPTITFGEYPSVRRVDVHLRNVAGIDAVIAELVALKQEMDPPVITAPDRPVHRLACGCTDPRCDCPGCQAGKPHEPGTTWNCDEHGRTAIAEAVDVTA